MKMRYLGWWVLGSLVLVAGFWVWTARPNGAMPPALALAGATDTTGFARATAPLDFVFPLDHGPHYAYQTEWWYYTGNVETATGQHYGYQLTFFRRGLTPEAPPSGAGLATNQVYFAHLAVTDVAGRQHHFAERFSRGADDLAGSTGSPFHVWLEDWSAAALDLEGGVIHLQAREGDLALDLTLRTTKPVVAHGTAGLSPKGSEPGNASYYLSFTRLATTGQITTAGRAVTVEGASWFDHEWSTSALSTGVVGWDWYSLQLSDGREVMFYALRHADGTLEPVSSGTLVDADGQVRHLAATDVQVEVLAHWRSPNTQASYPARWRLRIPSATIDLTIDPWLAEQEMRVTGTYWEGAVYFSGTSQGAAITGNGYIELTGYATSLENTF